jgi:hypothetical protein
MSSAEIKGILARLDALEAKMTSGGGKASRASPKGRKLKPCKSYQVRNENNRCVNKKDENKEKRAPSEYNKFMSQAIADLKAINSRLPEDKRLSPKEIFKAAAESWRNKE